MKNIYHEYSWMFMKIEEINEKKNAENQGVHFQNYSYLSC